MYMLNAQPKCALVHESNNLCELWHLHHIYLPILREIITSLPEFSVEQYGKYKGCALNKYVMSQTGYFANFAEI